MLGRWFTISKTFRNNGFLLTIFVFVFMFIFFLQRHSYISGKLERRFKIPVPQTVKDFEKLKSSNEIKLKDNLQLRAEQKEIIDTSSVIDQVLNRSATHNNHKLLELSKDIHVDTDIIDIMGKPQIQFLPEFKNPCFIGGETNTLFNDNNLHCLPYFYLIGVKKSGTTDLFHRISQHPEFRDPGFKEAQWFARLRFGNSCSSFWKKSSFRRTFKTGIDNRSIKFYISLFDEAARKIQLCPKGRCITAEASPSNLHMHSRWELLPGNEGLTEPRYTNFHYIKHITPEAKIIIIFRDPVSRLFSDFMHETRLRNRHDSNKKLAATFHRQVSVLIQSYEHCFMTYSMRRCMYNDTIMEKLQKDHVYLAESFRAGFYAFYMRELLSVFRRNQILPIIMTEYLSNIKETLSKTFQFLNMNPLSSEEMSKILRLSVSNSSKDKRMSEAKMEKETKEMLYNFYRPYNKEMAELMKDHGYIFPQS